mmetsp:Transcript_10960/g.12313  ORF Transcript_10960/g.12313 Transcript_10960/m.12313 type:complete len:227 (+) Transcript_10960:2-682(+)
MEQVLSDENSQPAITSEESKDSFVINTMRAIKTKEMLAEVLELNGWQSTVNAGEGDCFWCGPNDHEGYPEIVTTKAEAAYMRFPNAERVTDKNELGFLMNYMRMSYPEEYNFVTRTFIMPSQEAQLKAAMAENKEVTWICKPSDGNGGDDIELVNEFHEISEQMLKIEFVAQEYITKPYLIFNKKFDLRIYVPLFGAEHMNAYICEQGIGRFCAIHYQEPTAENKK